MVWFLSGNGFGRNRCRIRADGERKAGIEVYGAAVRAVELKLAVEVGEG